MGPALPSQTDAFPSPNPASAPCTHHRRRPARMQLPSLSMKPVDHRAVAKQVYDFAASQAPLAPLVKEALGVIDDAIESFGCVQGLN